MSLKKFLARSKTPKVYIGTHALLTQIPATLKSHLLTVFIDEQHKFGVSQREALKNRLPQPHIVNLTATPIPRTLALGLFGEITVTTIHHKPKSRLPVKTWVVSNNRFKKSNSWLSKEIANGNKIFGVCPFIESSVDLENVRSVTKTWSDYQAKYGSQTTVRLIHGKMKAQPRDSILAQFNQSPTGILVSTSIIEVGIDIPEANIIIIHSAERFGLAQLHQLRGRVGRGTKQGYCLVVPSTDDETNLERLELLTKYHSGLTLAKLDLKLRGVGEIAGLKQHGQFHPRLKYFWNKTLFQKAKATAINLVTTNPNLAKKLTSM